jgi:hypothetical protein
MTARPPRRDGEVPGIPAAPVVPPVPGAPARRRAGRVAWTLRTRWWPRCLLAGVLLVVVGATLLSGAAEAWVVFAGALVLLFVGFSLLSSSPADYKREPPMPPGAPGAGS